ncbi:hypothetical protein [Cytobacillus firmus]|uniref:hypothetical protein n=1 Tax=Cytobacillus firmus TaxID=1399 RepID=UPI0018CF5FBB|nr:hypothetical protein [Cytobacillus firmus]MBG9586553.1 hypothetical protein [Cytobacillus firmus]
MERETILKKRVFAKTDTQVKRGASSNALAVYTLKKGQQVILQSTVINGKEIWHRIVDGRKSGWIADGTIINQVTLSGNMYVKDENAVIRRGASSHYKTAGKLSYGKS